MLGSLRWVGHFMSSPNPVADQYSSFPYPEPGDDIPTWLTSFNYEAYEPAKFSVKFWPEGRPKTDLNILVAGCGSMQAAVIAFNNPECRVTGIDFSDASIAHEEQLRERHKLTNLTVRAMDLLGVSDLQQQFDLIICTGVLHHLPNPAEGLKALSCVIEPSHGVMLLMLYAKLGRIGIYPLQDAFRRMCIPQTVEGVAMVRSVINRLQPRHPGRWYFERSSEMRSPAAIVDTFLHRQDMAYNVQELLDLVESSGLKFQGWLDSAPYNIGFPDQDLESLCKDFPDRDRWSILEDLTMTRLTTHNFLARRPERDNNSQIDFDGERWLSYFPTRHPSAAFSQWTQGKFTREGYEFELSSAEAALFVEADGRQAVFALLKHRRLAAMAQGERLALARAFYERMWRHGHMFFSAIPVKACSNRS
jgi:trans-aconitate methyltransferase